MKIKIFAVFKNIDMTEGRGPMVLDSLWVKRDLAIEYMKTKEGIMGRSPFYTNHVTGHVSEGWHDPIAWQGGGDWQLKEIVTKDGVDL